MSTERAIARVHSPSTREIYGLLRSGRPWVLTGLMDHWRARTRWTSTWLAEEYGSLVVPVQRWSARDFASLQFEEMALSEYLERYSMDTCDGLHLSAYALFRAAPELRVDIEMPSGLGPPVDGDPLVFISPSGAVTPLHFDMCHNVYAQVWGRKRFLLVHPSQGRHLGAVSPWRSRWWWTSPVDLERSDAQRLAQVVRPAVEQVELAPGEMLLIPGGYWHQVRTLERGIAVGYFLETGIRQRVARRILRLLGRAVT